MKRLVEKMRRLRMTRWNKLTLGEKVVKVVWSLLKAAVVAAVVVALAGVVVAVVAGVVVAVGVGSALAGGFGNASRAYRSGDRYVRFR